MNRCMRSPSTRFFPGVVIPPEAEPYCDSRGIIDWKKVADLVCMKLNLDRSKYWEYHLTCVLKGIRDDDAGVLPILRGLKLDRIRNSIMAAGRRGSTDLSHQRALKFAKDFDIPLDKVIGTGPDGLILKRDVMAFHRGQIAQQFGMDDRDARLLRQRRILANHLRTSIQSARSLRAELDESESRVAATALRLGEEIAAKVADIEVLREHIAAVTADRNLLRAHLDESRSTIERLSKAAKTRRRITHIRLGNELFRNRTKEHV